MALKNAIRRPKNRNVRKEVPRMMAKTLTMVLTLNLIPPWTVAVQG
jgi:hypothetical protein